MKGYFWQQILTQRLAEDEYTSTSIHILGGCFMMGVRAHTHTQRLRMSKLLFFHVNVYVCAKFAARLMASDCNLLRLQMMAR